MDIYGLDNEQFMILYVLVFAVSLGIGYIGAKITLYFLDKRRL